MRTQGKKTPPAAPLASLKADPAAWLLAVLDLVGSGPAGAPMRQCPAHRDSSPSLSVRRGEDGRALVHCFAGCSTEDVLQALRCSWRHLYRPWVSPEQHVAVARLRLTFPPVEVRSGSPSERGLRLVAVHTYGDDQWRLERWRHAVTGAKDLRWHTVRSGAAVPGLLGLSASDLPLYREREVRMAVCAGERVHVVESESSVDALNGAGLYATTWAGGASSPNLLRLAAVLDGADVLLVPDNDEPGRACGVLILDALRMTTARVGYLLPDAGEDARDLLTAYEPVALGQPRAFHEPTEFEPGRRVDS